MPRQHHHSTYGLSPPGQPNSPCVGEYPGYKQQPSAQPSGSKIISAANVRRRRACLLTDHSAGPPSLTPARLPRLTCWRWPLRPEANARGGLPPPLLSLTCLAPSVDVRWRPLVYVAVVTQLGTHPPSGRSDGSRGLIPPATDRAAVLRRHPRAPRILNIPPIARKKSMRRKCATK
jgi:hypothetical protein